MGKKRKGGWGGGGGGTLSAIKVLVHVVPLPREDDAVIADGVVVVGVLVGIVIVVVRDSDGNKWQWQE